METDIQKIKKIYLKYRQECYDQILKENSVNRIICVIREKNRAMNKEATEKNIPVKKDGFIILFKKSLGKMGIPDELKKAMKYL